MLLPECVVSGMLCGLVPPGQLVQASGLGEISRRAGAKKVFVVLISLADDRMPCAPHRCLFGEVIEIRLPKGAEMKPVVAHPPIDHGAHWRCDFQRGMRID